ncbi:FecR family protein [Flexithrix dorotheae]|uniref:FecR family protein n=1 Tax=Flexithrix dorotheae TaxID=70993 RepID=UPI0003725C5D|nr:FecR family protein [Flexithrix dorotheae]
MNYLEYQTEDFLSDEFFIKWVNEPNEETNHFWEKWLQNHPEKSREINLARQITKNIHYGERYDLSDQHYIEMFEKIIRTDSSTINKQKKKWNFKWISGIAASILIGLIVGFGFFLNMDEPAESPPISYIIKKNPKGKKSTIILKDGTKIKLNSESSLKIPEHFSGNVRRVFLEGEAFFEVAENKDKPFIVVVGHIEAKVLGTSFNINNFQEVNIALVEGKLQVSDADQNKLILHPNEMITYSGKGKIKKDLFDKHKITGWQNGILIFDNEPLTLVFEKIERWYGVEIQVDESVKLKGSYSGIYEKEPLINVIKGISITSGFSYDLNNKVLKITN